MDFDNVGKFAEKTVGMGMIALLTPIGIGIAVVAKKWSSIKEGIDQGLAATGPHQMELTMQRRAEREAALRP